MAKVPAASKPSKACVHDDQWRIPTVLWEWVENSFGMLQLECAFITYHCSGLLG